MKTISSSLTIVGIVTLLGGLPFVANAEPAPVVNGGARYFKNLEAGNVNTRSYQRVFEKDNRVVLTYPSFTIRYRDVENFASNNQGNGTVNLRVEPLGINGNGTPQYQYRYNNQGVVVLPLGERLEAIPYNRQGDASLQLTGLRVGGDRK